MVDTTKYDNKLKFNGHCDSCGREVHILLTLDDTNKYVCHDCWMDEWRRNNPMSTVPKGY